MDMQNETSVVTREEYDKLLEKLKAVENENNKLARELRVSENRNAVFKLNAETQSSINKKITTEKQKQEMYVRLLLESCPDIIFILDEKMKFLLGTNSISDVIDIDDVSILQGRELDAIVERYNPPALTTEMLDLIKKMTKERHDRRLEEKLEIATSHNKYAVNIWSFTKNTDKYVLVIMHDITEMVKAKELAEEASRAKGDFLSRMSHEMRTPMNAIIGMTSIAKGSRDLDKITYCLNKIDSASKHLLNVINDILDISKIEANKLELSCQEFDLEKMLMNISNVVNVRVEERKQNLIINLHQDVPSSIIGDEFRITQVITNLLTNAVKFTPVGGSIQLDVGRLLTAGNETTLQIEVLDTGIGISADQQFRLFRSFEQADGGVARKYGGTGLGLAICKRIVEMMDGRIWVESELGKGSKFIFTIKVQIGQMETKPKFHVSKENIRILAVDDSPEIRAYFTYVMEEFGLSCDVAMGGYEALRMLNEHRSVPYNIFFVDWQMPEMNGVELARKIKEATEDNAVIIMISMTEWSEIEEEAVAAGVNRFISKPLFPSVLIDSINECLCAVHSDKTIVCAPAEQVTFDYKNYTLLIAEDVEINREIMAAVLEDTGVSIDFAENGIEAVTLVKENPGKYSLILMDIQMPELDGYGATKAIRALDCKEAETIPIIAMTANVFREDIENCMKAGMNDHIGKPVDVVDLYNKLQRYL